MTLCPKADKENPPENCQAQWKSFVHEVEMNATAIIDASSLMEEKLDSAGNPGAVNRALVNTREAYKNYMDGQLPPDKLPSKGRRWIKTCPLTTDVKPTNPRV